MDAVVSGGVASGLTEETGAGLVDVHPAIHIPATRIARRITRA
jgi:hypothetical protein